jgi:HD-GYP domain-containing protein (c-di-GMP phosphodiesterase class II)
MVLVFNRNKKRNLPGNNGHAETREYQTRLGLLCDIAEEASSITQVSTLLGRILKVTQRTVGSSITSVFLKDEARARVHLPITVSKYEDATRSKAAVIESEIADIVAGNVMPVLSNNVAADTRFNLDSQKTADSIVRSVIAAPILKGKNVIGVLMAANKDGGAGFNQRDYEVLKGFAATEAIILLVSLERTAIGNVNCLTLNENLMEGYRDTVHELASTIDVKDAQVYAHARRTKEYALLAASSLPLQPRELQTIEFGALLHDIGKIGIDSRILCKPGPLTDEEWKIVYEHPQKGADILKDIPHLKDATNIVLCHHERYDGTGYPRKLKGDEIPIGARLVSVANAFDTMTTNNPYRAAFSIDDAMRELIEGTGTQFCPKAVEAFISAYKKQGNLPAKASPDETKTKEDKPTGNRVIIVDKGTTDTRDLIIKVKKEAKEAKKLKIKAEKAAKETKKKAEKEAKDARKKAEKLAKEAKINAERKAREAKIQKIKAEKEAREAKIKAEKEAKEAKVKAEKEAKETKVISEKKAKEAKIIAEKEAEEIKVEVEKKITEAQNITREEAKKPEKVEKPPKIDTAKMDAEICKENIRLVAPIATPNEAVKALGRDLEKIQGIKILMLSHCEEEGHLFLLALQKPLTLMRFIREIPRVENVSKKGGEISVVLRDNAS